MTKDYKLLDPDKEKSRLKSIAIWDRKKRLDKEKDDRDRKYYNKVVNGELK